MDEARRLALALALAPGIGPVRHRELAELHGGAAAAADSVLRGSTRDLALTQADRLAHLAEGAGARICLRDEAAYPASLRDLPDPPPYLFARGELAVLDRPGIAVVGTRQASAYAERVTRELARAVARAGAVVISGMARGVDSAAHWGALEANGATAAVLGTGIDVPYPAAHAGLYERIVAEGLVLSEHAPGEHAGPASFPRRNRIIAALAAMTLVVEAGVKSGALITAEHALQLGRTVAAVPGPIDSPVAAGSNLLLRDGAAVIAAVDDVLALMDLPTRRAAPLRLPDGDARRIWDALARPASDLDELAARSGLPARRCVALVGRLELQGTVECALTGEIRRR